MSKTNDINKQLRRDLMEVRKRVVGDCWSEHSCWSRVVKSPAPRFYVTPKQAYQVLLPMVDGDWSDYRRMSARRQRMYKALYERVMELAAMPQNYKKSLWFLMPFAVTSPAPEFFVSERWFRQIFLEEKRGYRYKPRFKEYVRRGVSNG